MADRDPRPTEAAVAVAPDEEGAGRSRRQLLRGVAALASALVPGVAAAQSKASDLPPNIASPKNPDPKPSGASVPPPADKSQKAEPEDTSGGAGPIPRRPFGKAAGVSISALGVGGHHLGDAASFEESVEIVARALDAGIDFFDNCWEYHNGKSENWLGRALKGKRDKAFLMTKVCTHGRGGALGMKMLEESLRRLGTDHLDLWQVHAVSFDDDPALAYAKGGILEAMAQAKKQGKVRFVGFTGHKHPEFHLEMINRGFPFDAVQMPLNALDSHFFSFEKRVLPVAKKKGMAILGMKSMGGTADVVKQGVLTAEECLRYAMSLPVTTTISGMESLKVLQQNLTIARGFKPLGATAMNAIRDKARKFAGDGRFELYKVSLKFDNPATRMPHGFPFDPQEKEVKDILEGGEGLPGTVEARP